MYPRPNSEDGVNDFPAPKRPVSVAINSPTGSGAAAVTVVSPGGSSTPMQHPLEGGAAKPSGKSSPSPTAAGGGGSSAAAGGELGGGKRRGSASTAERDAAIANLMAVRERTVHGSHSPRSRSPDHDADSGGMTYHRTSSELRAPSIRHSLPSTHRCSCVVVVWSVLPLTQCTLECPP